MFQYLQPAAGPVVPALQKHELQMGKGQPEYNVLRCLPGNTEHGERLSRWTLTQEQREAIAAGADIYIELCTFNQPMNPIRVAVATELNAGIFKQAYKL